MILISTLSYGARAVAFLVLGRDGWAWNQNQAPRLGISQHGQKKMVQVLI